MGLAVATVFVAGLNVALVLEYCLAPSKAPEDPVGYTYAFLVLLVLGWFFALIGSAIGIAGVVIKKQRHWIAALATAIHIIAALSFILVPILVVAFKEWHWLR